MNYLQEIAELLGDKDAKYKPEEQLMYNIQQDIRLLQQVARRVSPATSPCSCPEFCSYHARSVFNQQRDEIRDMQEAIREVDNGCPTCRLDMTCGRIPSSVYGDAVNELEALKAGALEMNETSDYTLKEDAESCWITVGPLSVYVRRGGDPGVIVDIFPRRREMNEPLASCYAFDSDATGCEECTEEIGEDGDIELGLCRACLERERNRDQETSAAEETGERGGFDKE